MEHTPSRKKNSDFFNGRLTTARHEEEDAVKKNIFTYQVFSCKGLSNDESGVARDPVLDEMRSGAGFQTGDFVGEKLGGGGGIMP